MSFDICVRYTNNFKEQEVGAWTEGVVGIRTRDKGHWRSKKGIGTERDRVKCTLTIAQDGYALKVLANFGMDQAKSRGTPMEIHFKLRAAIRIEERDQGEKMNIIPYQSSVGSLMYS